MTDNRRRKPASRAELAHMLILVYLRLLAIEREMADLIKAEVAHTHVQEKSHPKKCFVC